MASLVALCDVLVLENAPSHIYLHQFILICHVYVFEGIVSLEQTQEI